MVTGRTSSSKMGHPPWKAIQCMDADKRSFALETPVKKDWSQMTMKSCKVSPNVKFWWLNYILVGKLTSLE